MNRFPYGIAALCLLIASLVSGVWVLAHPAPKPKTTLRMWTFAKPHYDAYQSAIKQFEAENPGITVDIQLVSYNATTQRLRAAFWADLDVPDMVEVEIGAAGSFFRGSQENIGFRDLTPWIEAEGLKERMIEPRFSAYTTRGRIYGLPHDVHPVLMAYRRDIFEKEGVDPKSLKTWDDFVKVGRKLTIPGKRYMIELADTNSADMEVILFQRGGGYFNADGGVIFDNEDAVKTMLQYVPMVAGKNKIGNTLGGGQVLTQAVEDGYLICEMMPDWRSKGFQNDIGNVSGKMALMPLPAIEPGGRQTSTRGGTMLGITKACKNPEAAWKLAKFLYLNDKDLAQRFAGTNIVPPVRSAWKLPEFNKPNPYWSNQPLGKLYAEQAPNVPPQFGSPYVQIAKGKLGEAVTSCVERYKQTGDKGFEPFVRAQLKARADEVRVQISRNPYYKKQ